MALPKSAATRQAILDAARNAFARKGYSGTQIKDITNGLSVTRANFYYYFRDKQELFIELGTETYRETHAVVEKFGALPDAPSMPDLLGWVRAYYDYLDRNGAFVVRSVEDSPDDPKFQTSVAQLHRRSARTLGEQIASRSSQPVSSAAATGMTVMAMLERSWFLAHNAGAMSVDAAICAGAQILERLLR
jgi:AcrR family transcriptional regulator